MATFDGVLHTVGDVGADTGVCPYVDDSAALVAKTVAEAGGSALGFRQMRLIVPGTRFAWVPEHLFDAARMHQYLNLVAEVGEGMGVYHAYSSAVNSYIVFAAPESLVTSFKVTMPGIDVINQHSALVTKHLLHKSSGHPVVLLHVGEGMVDIEALYNDQLLLSNSFAADEEEELLYHALNVMKRLHLETPDMELSICGNVERNLYARLQHFFPNVTLYTGVPFRYLNPEFETLHTYRYPLILS